MRQPVVERFLRYIAIDTKSDPESTTTPSSDIQWDLAKLLKEDMEQMGLQDVSLDDNCYLMGTLPANCDWDQPVIGFVSHMDSAPDMSGKDIKPQFVQYKGGDIILDAKEDIRISVETFPDLEDYKGQEIITTDGHTLLAADDKAGISAILEAVQYLIDHPEIKHGAIKVGFTPDEEIGRGADKFDVKKFGADFAYTIDGGKIGELQFENFNAAGAKVTFKGLNVHPGDAKGKMINAQLLAMEYNSYLPEALPSNTEGYEGFYHLVGMSGTVEEAELHYILRDHDREQFEIKKSCITEIARRINEIYGAGRCTAIITDQYFNMREVVEDKMYIVNHAAEAMKAAGVEPVIEPIRGGTDGAKLSYMGLPCPNIFAGGHNFHGRYEYLPVPSLEKSMEVIIKIASTEVKK
ncbi:peptidase T [Porphyromonas levii]|uniref:Peptidase T n=1 Tax=Porphyromonas levii TaxID=28114 RepID=A0A4Y8WRT4_9PORP|nr:peptidase T [Porphyromonas levii]MBR8713212.1 Peptidase T [Porphyromonas levii]MBR8715217.1 Peptidase T [Porphyromonas levii]MBR8727743.1 Peptidase T [Porphyromonas levii]MBR8731328.1 Peptidase T [Porphyromonas levii]MBR8736120.1 Peptidase T [Porphyromonas levii]